MFFIALDVLVDVDHRNYTVWSRFCTDRREIDYDKGDRIHVRFDPEVDGAC